MNERRWLDRMNEPVHSRWFMNLFMNCSFTVHERKSVNAEHKAEREKSDERRRSGSIRGIDVDPFDIWTAVELRELNLTSAAPFEKALSNAPRHSGSPSSSNSKS
jgi:hypothetical protein